jgi:D-glycero-D-manno-heptose 1,7-bisphosphate phosphatase
MTKPQVLRPAVFLDRDGTLNVEVNYLHREEDFVWIPGAPEAVRRLNAAGLLVFVVTNQAGVAHGYYDEGAVERLHRFMQASLAASGARVDAFYYSPYHPQGRGDAVYRRDSPCRKPATGMFEEALQAWPVDPARSFVVGDRNTDIEAGRTLGLTTLLVETGYGAAEKATTQADYIEADLPAAVERILGLMETTPEARTRHARRDDAV